MAIVTISRIQHRRGYYENLPQLAAAELGWAVDSRRLFIGNGPLSEGAPATGNTEILTQFSDILSISESYTFKNTDAGYTVTTGPDANSPIVRTIQKKFDDFASVKDFGAKGDGSTDDTAAINRALYQLYCRETFSGARKTLYFPAGRYIVSDIIKVPSDATLMGEGPNNTIIVQTGDVNTVGTVIHTADTLQQIGTNIGLNGARLPADIKISNMGLETNLDGIHVIKSNRVTLERVKITGPENLPTVDYSVNSTSPAVGIYLSGSVAAPGGDINLIDCYFTKLNYAVWQNVTNEVINDVNISSSTFDNLYQGILLGIAGGSAKNFIVSNCIFDNIYGYAIDVDNVDNFVSSFNHYQDVGNHYNGVGDPQTNIIKFNPNAINSGSIGDLFDRTAADNAIFSAVVTNENNAVHRYGQKINLGLWSIGNGKQAVLTDNTSNGSFNISYDTTVCSHVKINYNIERNSNYRSGFLNVSFNGSTYSIDDDSTETADVGVTFSISISGGIASLLYTTTNTGVNANLYYSICQLTDVV